MILKVGKESNNMQILSCYLDQKQRSSENLQEFLNRQFKGNSKMQGQDFFCESFYKISQARIYSRKV
jgi:hypothetical protein